MSISKEQIFTLLDDKCQRHFGCYLKEATNTQVFKATCLVVRDMLAKKRQTFCDQYEGKKQSRSTTFPWSFWWVPACTTTCSTWAWRMYSGMP